MICNTSDYCQKILKTILKYSTTRIKKIIPKIISNTFAKTCSWSSCETHLRWISRTRISQLGNFYKIGLLCIQGMQKKSAAENMQFLIQTLISKCWENRKYSAGLEKRLPPNSKIFNVRFQNSIVFQTWAFVKIKKSKLKFEASVIWKQRHRFTKIMYKWMRKKSVQPSFPEGRLNLPARAGNFYLKLIDFF